MDVSTLTQINAADGKREFGKLNSKKKKMVVEEIVKAGYEPDKSETNANYNDLNCSLFPLPVDYCKIMMFRDNSYVVAFDLMYFNTFITSGLKRKLMQYPKEIRDAFVRYNSGNSGNQWVILDNTKTIVTKIGGKRDHPWGLPIATAALSDIMYYDYFTRTKRNMLDDINNVLIWQELPEGERKNMSSLSQQQQLEQHNKIKESLLNNQPGMNGKKVITVAPGTKINKMEYNLDLYDSKNEADLLERICGDVGFAAALLNGVSKGNYASLKLNLELVSSKVYSWIRQFQAELNKVINYNVIKDPKCFIEVDYLPMSYVNKTDMIGYMKDLYSLGKGSWQAWVSATGLNFDSFISMLEDESDKDYENKFPLHKTSFTMTAKDETNTDADHSGRGRPANPD
jgi:hypothetical protein